MGLNHATNLNFFKKKSHFGHFFARCAIFVRHHFLLYLSILGGALVMWHFCKVPLFTYGIKGCSFCWVPFLLGVSDGAAFVFFYS